MTRFRWKKVIPIRFYNKPLLTSDFGGYFYRYWILGLSFSDYLFLGVNFTDQVIFGSKFYWLAVFGSKFYWLAIFGSKFYWLAVFSPNFNENACLRGFADNKGADQPALPRSLINTFVIRLLKSTIPRLATSEISIF